MKAKKINNSFFRILRISFIVLFCNEMTVSAATQLKDLFVWNGSTSNDWATGSNWTVTRGSTPGTSTFPGEVATNDSVVVNNGGIPSLASGAITICSLTITNAANVLSGSIFTINNGATLTVSGTTSSSVTLKGGNLVNNGTLNISTGTSSTGYAINCGTPTSAPGSATIYSLSGSGSLSINTSTGNGGLLFNGTDANSTYKITFPAVTSVTLKANTSAFTVAAGAVCPIIISGAGFTLGSSGIPVQAGILIQNGGGTNVTIDSGTTITLYSASGGSSKGVYLYFTTGGGSFTNNGNLYGYGTEGAAFLQLTNSYATGTNTLTLTNTGIVSTNMAVTATYAGIMNITNGTTSNINTINNSGTITLKNTQTSGTGLGYALYCGNGTACTTTFTNSGIFELYGTLTSTGGLAGKVIVNNTGTVNILNMNLDKVVFNNNSGGILDCKTNQVTSGTSYVVTLNSGSTLKTANTSGLSCLGGTGAVINSGVNYVYNAAVAQTTGSSLASPNNVEINNAAGVTLTTASTTVNGTLTLTSGAFNIGANTLTLKGSVANNGGTLTHYSSTPTTFGTLIFNGSSAQNFPALTNNKCKLVTINNAAGVSLNSGISIDSTLTLTSGKLSLGTNDLTIGTKGSIAGASSTNYIVTDGMGKLNQNVGSSSTMLFPVGASVSSYDPVNVTPTTGTSFGVRAYTTLSGTPAYGVRYNPKEWDITPAVASSTVIALTPSNLVESVTSPVIGHYVSGAYVNNNTVNVNSGTFTGTFDTFSPFVTGANVDVTAIQSANESTKPIIYASNGTINIDNSIGKTINVYTATGSKIRTIISNSNNSAISIGKGIYFISVDTKTQKVVVQ